MNDSPNTTPNASPSFPQFQDEMAEIFESFLVETQEIFERLGQDLLSLEKDPLNKDLHNTIFRAVHTVKGTSSFIGFEQLTELAHHFEDVLNKLRRGELSVTSDMMDVMFTSFDLMKEILRRIQAQDATPVAVEAIQRQLLSIAEGHTMERAEETTPPVAPNAGHPNEPAKAGREVASPEAPAGTAAPAPARQAIDSTIRVDIARLDSLMNLVGELVLGRNRLAQLSSHLAAENENQASVKELSETSAQIDFITTELQMAVMKTRMVPIAKVFNKLPRLIRDLSKEVSKQIDLQLVGEETELDKSIIEELNDPLVHLLRNSADHGIELPEVRTAGGKAPVGTVVVKAEHEGNHIVLSIMDDGAGIDPDIIKRKAIEKGILTESEARDMSKRDALELIFHPGFSTAAKVTNVSGRGVGMDVVRTNVSRLKGTIDIDSEVGVGTTFLIKLPLTLAILQGLLVQARGEIFAIPLASVLEVVHVHASDVKSINGRRVIRLRETVLPIARLDTVLGREPLAEEAEKMYIVVIGAGERRLGIVVDSMLGQREVVIKSLGGFLGSVSGIAGSTILGDGRVIMILDVGQFMQIFSRSTHQLEDVGVN